MTAVQRRITYVIDHFIPWKAGTEHQLSMLLENLPRDWDVELIVFRDSEFLEAHGQDISARRKVIKINNFKSLSTYGNILGLVRHLRRTKPDVVHTFFPVANIIGVIAARLASVPTIISSRRDFGEWMTPRYLKATRFANRFVSSIITNSTRVADMTAEVEGVDRESIRVIGNGIDSARFEQLPDRAAARERLGIGPDQQVIGLVANYRPMKRHQTLIRAAARMAADYPAARFLLVGTNATEDDIQSRMQALAKELGVEDRVMFLHSDDDIRELLTAFDIGANCSEGEGLSNAIMEYMASGLPCVVAASGGNGDLISDGENGRLFPLDDDEALAGILGELLDDEAERQRLGTGARQTIADRYSISKMASEFVAAYSVSDPPLAARAAAED